MTPILLCGQGRSGTTGLMKLLASSDAVFCDQVYPFEKRYLTYIAKLAHLLNRDVGYSEFTIEDLANFDISRLGRLPWYYDAGYAETDWPPPASNWLSAFWQAFSGLVRARYNSVRFYAEKSAAWVPAVVRESFFCHVIYLIRDPRDVLISSRMFQEKDTSFLSGMEDPYDENQLIHRVSFEFINYYENLVTDTARADTLRLRYEDLICSEDEKVAAIEQLLEVHLDSDKSRIGWASHGTAPSLLASIERWKKEKLAPHINTKFLHCIGKEIGALGYETDCLPSSNHSQIEFSSDSLGASAVVGSEDGELIPEEQCARINVWASDFWLTLPIRRFDADSIDHIWVCINGGAGNYCSVYWRASTEDYSEERAFHVEYRANESWRVLDFPVYRHPRWRGRIEELRLDVFNRTNSGFGKQLSGSVECNGTGHIRWVRLLNLGHQASSRL